MGSLNLLERTPCNLCVLRMVATRPFALPIHRLQELPLCTTSVEPDKAVDRWSQTHANDMKHLHLAPTRLLGHSGIQLRVQPSLHIKKH